jgi:hypothetical protein
MDKSVPRLFQNSFSSKSCNNHIVSFCVLSADIIIIHLSTSPTKLLCFNVFYIILRGSTWPFPHQKGS